MAEEYSYLKKQEYALGFVQENIELVIYSILSFSLPLIIGHPQWLVGTLVNAALVLAALNLKDYKLLPVIMLPSFGVLTAGLIFGKFTMFLVYMIPMIWIGNFVLVWGMKKLYLQKKINKWATLAISASLKTAFLFVCAFTLVKFGVLPALFLTTMGLFQLYTAVAGGILAFGVQGIKKAVKA
jgi:hypothetical protein